jgi:hypothetical protein
MSGYLLRTVDRHTGPYDLTFDAREEVSIETLSERETCMLYSIVVAAHAYNCCAAQCGTLVILHDSAIPMT